MTPSRPKINALDTRDLALIAIFSSLWIVSQLYLGSIIGSITQVHGVVQRTFGWLLMLVLARLTGRLGRVTMMTAITSLATRIIRPGRLYAIFVGLGYALGGLTFDLLYFLPIKEDVEGRAQKAYLLSISLLSGAIALIPYILFKLYLLGFHGLILWLPLYVYNMMKSVVLSFSGTLIGITILPHIEIWINHIRQDRI